MKAQRLVLSLSFLCFVAAFLVSKPALLLAQGQPGMDYVTKGTVYIPKASCQKVPGGDLCGRDSGCRSESYKNANGGDSCYSQSCSSGSAPTKVGFLTCMSNNIEDAECATKDDPNYNMAVKCRECTYWYCGDTDAARIPGFGNCELTAKCRFCDQPGGMDYSNKTFVVLYCLTKPAP